MWAIIRTGNAVSAVIGPFQTYEKALEFCLRTAADGVNQQLVPYHTPDKYLTRFEDTREEL